MISAETLPLSLLTRRNIELNLWFLTDSRDTWRNFLLFGEYWANDRDVGCKSKKEEESDPIKIKIKSAPPWVSMYRTVSARKEEEE